VSVAEPSIILALGTSTERCSVALALSAAPTAPRFFLDEVPERGHSGHVLLMIRRVLELARLDASRIDAIAFDAGPGAFTGLRVGCGVAQGLGLALDRKLVAIGSLAAVAVQGGPGLSVVALDARMGEVYWALMDVSESGDARTVLGPSVCAPRELLMRLADALAGQTLRPVRALGDGFIRHPDLAGWAGEAGLGVEAGLWPCARAIAELAYRELSRGHAVDAATAAPLYVRDKVALDVVEQAQLRERRA
jgi:tRNA threonylcarbamoyladenosine biosynthesis protein TsaB